MEEMTDGAYDLASLILSPELDGADLVSACGRGREGGDCRSSPSRVGGRKREKRRWARAPPLLDKTLVLKDLFAKLER